ncbi:MAG: hypothetical protein JWL72_4910, partial [Ilumatobacteraceae bacterium]|nr:hypothetical protein [Ilumatobacteraceae bacterium]
MHGDQQPALQKRVDLIVSDTDVP